MNKTTKLTITFYIISKATFALEQVLSVLLYFVLWGKIFSFLVSNKHQVDLQKMTNAGAESVTTIMGTFITSNILLTAQKNVVIFL